MYNFWNKRKEFIWLKNQNIRYNINYQGFFSLNFKIFNKSRVYDYFVKWSSSYIKISDFIVKNLIDNRNKNKSWIELRRSIDYTVSDNIF